MKISDRRWHLFDEDTKKNRDATGAPTTGIDHKASLARNLKKGLKTLAIAPLTPFACLATLPHVKTGLERFGLLVGVFLVPVAALFLGVKDLAVDAPMHGAAILFGKS